MIKVFWHDFDFCFQEFQDQLFGMLAENDNIGLDLNKLRFDFQDFADGIIGCTVFDRHVIPPCRVAKVDTDTFQIAITSDHPKDVGKAVWMSFPYDFISRLTFEEPVVQNYSQYIIRLMKDTWTIGAACENPESAYALAMCEMLKLEGKDIKQALDYCYRSAEAGYSYAKESLICICLEALDNNIEVDPVALDMAVKYAEEWHEIGNPYGGYYLGFYYLYKYDYSSAMRFFTEVMEREDTSPSMKSSVAEVIAPFYKDGLYDARGNTVVYRNYYTAKKYYEIANYNNEFDADLANINSRLGIRIDQNRMQKLAEDVLANRPQPTGREIYAHVIEDLSAEFGEYWMRLPESSRQDLVSGCHVYIMLHSLGEDLCKEIDFSSAIIPIVKACEIVFRRYISSGYYDYLINNGINVTELPSEHPFIRYDRYARKVAYKDREKIEFTLGAIKYVIDLKNGPNGLKIINKHFIDYACGLFGVDKANRSMRNKVESYFVKLANQMNQFTFNVRNPAAHSDIMPIWQAEICGNEIIKVRKVLKEFMEHIS